jgi:hypothetical protein
VQSDAILLLDLLGPLGNFDETRKLLKDLVDLIGIEPMTSSMPWKRAPSCATGPLLGRTLSILADCGIFVNVCGNLSAMCRCLNTVE